MEPGRLDVEIARTIADHEGVDAATLEPPLHDVVDVDALEALLRTRPHDRTEFTGTVTFEYGEHTIIVDHTGTVSVRPTAEDDGAELART